MGLQSHQSENQINVIDYIIYNIDVRVEQISVVVQVNDVCVCVCVCVCGNTITVILIVSNTGIMVDHLDP